MQQLQPMGGQMATLTKIQFTGGEAEFSEENITEARNLERQLSTVLKLSVLTVAQILCEVHRKKYFLIDNEKLVAGADGEFQTPDTERAAFEQWARRRGLGHTYSHLMKWIKIAELYDEHQQFFNSIEELPTKGKLLTLAQHRDHPQILRLLEASVGTPVDWRATVNEVLKGQDPDEAQEVAEEEVKEIRERVAAHRTPLNQRLRWESEEFRKWVRSQPCILTGTQDFQQVDPAHIYSRGAGADDFRNVVPLRNDLHSLAHHRGWSSLLDRYGKDET